MGLVLQGETAGGETCNLRFAKGIKRFLKGMRLRQ